MSDWKTSLIPLQSDAETDHSHAMDLEAALGPAKTPHAEPTPAHGGWHEAPIDPPDRMAALLELACDQQLQIASKLEQILELMSGPDEAGMLDKLKELLAPLLEDTAAIRHQLGAG